MNLTIHSTFINHLDPEASLAFYRDKLGQGSDLWRPALVSSRDLAILTKISYHTRC